MIVKVVLKRFAAALLSLMMVFGAFPSFAATSCCDSANMAMQMSAAPSHGANQNHNMPCKMPAGLCASICASMHSVAVIVPPVAYVAPVIVAELSSSLITPSGGISQLPALPPPITLV